jgi:hypothetical protein
MNNLITVAHATSYRAQTPSSAVHPSLALSLYQRLKRHLRLRKCGLSLYLQPICASCLFCRPQLHPKVHMRLFGSPLCNSIGTAGYIHSSGATRFVWCTVRLVASVESVTAFRDFATIFREKSWPSISSAAFWACSRDLSAAWVGRKNL